MCSFDILLPIGGAVSLVFGVLFLCFRGVVLNFRGLDFNFTKVTILLHIPQYLFPFFQLLNSEAYRQRIVLRSPPDQIPSAARSDSVRRPIGFRPPSDQIPNAARPTSRIFSSPTHNTFTITSKPSQNTSMPSMPTFWRLTH